MMNFDKGIYFIVGHRGTGKTTWAQSVCSFFERKKYPVLFLDVDKELEKETNLSINQILLKGESFFREKENKCVQNCVQKAKEFNGVSFISVGAGYKGEIPSFCYVIHLKRRSDKEGRIFFDRPRLQPHLNPLDEYKNLYSEREFFYKKQRDFVLTRFDHFKSFEKWDEVFFGEKPLPFKNGVITLNPEEFRKKKTHKNKFDLFCDQKLKWNLKYFEIKDDQLTNEFLKEVLKNIPSQKILFSFRENNKLDSFDSAHTFFNIYRKKTGYEILDQKMIFDWPIEWGENKKLNPHIYSLHKRDKKISLEKQLSSFSKIKNVQLKLAIEIFSFEELWKCHLWWKQDPLHRSFHPRSKNGRWKWYRLLFGPHQPLYFICEDDENEIKDQPLMAESVRLGDGVSKEGFVSVLGDPVWHSATPYEQGPFFNQYNLPVLEIPMKEDEMTLENIKILKEMGLRFSAITSPLKKKAYSLFGNGNFNNEIKNENFQKSKDKVKSENFISSINTIVLIKNKWKGFNTDLDGMNAFIEKMSSEIENFSNNKKMNFSLKLNEKVAVWGGFGVRDVLKEKLKSASFFSARTGELLEQRDVFQNDVQKKTQLKIKESNKSFNPEIVIWAVGRMRMSSCQYPPSSWKPSCVFDLNYTEDSPGREYALKTGAHYISGWSWFKGQALAQREIFKNL